MDFKKLVTLTLPKNVGPVDRVLRLLSGAGLVVLGRHVELAPWAAIALTVLGVLWAATGVLSRCSIYYLLGFSTCPVSGAANPALDAGPTRASGR